MKGYTIRPTAAVEDRLKEVALTSKLQLHPLVSKLLVQRGISSVAMAQTFLWPRLGEMPSPFAMKGMQEGVALIMDALEKKMPIVIHGDYDVDGITGTVIIYEFLELLDVEVLYYLPNRMEEGYGLSKQSLEKTAGQVKMPAVLITVDNGISAVEEIQYANQLGYKAIVTDHHQVGKILPNAKAIINPAQADCTFNSMNISGAGVAFFFIMALRRKLVEERIWQKENMPNLKHFLDLVALGTVADVMELKGLNRMLVKAGLEVITSKKRKGIEALCVASRLTEGQVRSEDISFRLAPRLNAAGRLGTPALAAQLLLAKDSIQATHLAEELEQVNLKRREFENNALADALRQAQEQVENGKMGLVIYNKEWHPGVIGIIASRVVDKFDLPVLVMIDDTTSSESNIKGSGRSVNNLNLFQALSSCQGLLKKFGGHAMAAGLVLSNEKFDEFCLAFNKYVTTYIKKDDSKKLIVDLALASLDEVIDIGDSLQLMEPFGQGNEEPIFLLKNAKLGNVKKLRDHLKFTLQVQGRKINGIGFYMASSFEKALSPVDLCFKIKHNIYRGVKRVEVHAVEIF